PCTVPVMHPALASAVSIRAVALLAALAPRIVALGGGGYDIGNVARAWAAAWAVLNGVELSADLPPAFVEYAKRFHLRMASLWDPPAMLDDDRRARVQEDADRQVDEIRRLIFPIQRLRASGARGQGFSVRV